MILELCGFILLMQTPDPPKKADEKAGPKSEATSPPKSDAKPGSLFKRKRTEPLDAQKKANDEMPLEIDRRVPEPEQKPPAGKLSDTEKELVKNLEKELGLEDDPLQRAAKRMRAVEESLAKVDVSQETSELQTKIVEDLKKLLERRNSQDQKQQKKQKEQREKQQSQQEQQQSGQKNGQQKSAQQKGKQENRDTPRVGRATQAELAKMKEQRDIWGHLPEMERQLLDQSFKEDKLPEYRGLLEKYYSRIAEMSGDKGN